MLAVLGWILSGVELMGTYVALGVELAVDAGLAAMVAAASAALALLPSMSDAPSIGSPTWLQWLSWFYPVGDLVAGLTALVALWVAFLAVRYVLRLTRAI